MRRVVIKVGSSSLTTDSGHVDPQRIHLIADAIAAARSVGDEIVLVSSGAIASGLGPLGLERRPRDLATQQAAASVGQGVLVAQYSEAFADHGITVGQVLLTVDDVTRRSHYKNAHQTFAKLLEMGALPVVNENDTVATSEIRFGDNDRLAALVAHLVHADELILLSDVDGLYTGHPDDPASRLIPEVTADSDMSDIDVSRIGSKVGTGGMQTKIEASRIATEAGIAVVLTDTGRIAEALAGKRPGTYFHPTGKRRPSRLLWLAHASETKGSLVLDAGAVRAVVHKKASLLPAGITAVTGSFSAGDPIDLTDDTGRVVARGLVNYDSKEIPALMGRQMPEISAEYGWDHEREVVHRDDLIVKEEAR